MSLSFEPADPAYIAYIDEAGDTGLARLKPDDPGGSTEWLVLAALVVRLSNDAALTEAVRKIRTAINSKQGPALHYRGLAQPRKVAVCEMISELPIRGFALLSYKKTMQGHRNARVEAARGASTQEFFYNYCVRLLLERVTDFAEKQSIIDYGTAIKHLQIVFSERGGLRYSQTVAYLDLIRNQARSGTTFLKKREIAWRVLHPNLISSIPHHKSAGAQLADPIASAFFQATNTSGQGSWDPIPAQKLQACIWEQAGVYEENGVSLQPNPYWKANLNERQKDIFRFYGFSL